MSAKLKLIERKLGLVPKHYPPMSPGMERLARRLPEQAPAPVPETGLGATIEKLIADEVERRVGEAEERARQQHLLDRQFNAPEPVSDYRQLPSVPRTPAPKAPLEMVIHRDGAGHISWCELSDGTKVQCVRDRAGKMIALKEVTESPVLPALDVPYKSAARKYQPGEPR